MSVLASERKGTKGFATPVRPPATRSPLWADLYSPVAHQSGPGNCFHVRQKRARAHERVLRQYKKIHYMLSLVIEEQQNKLERSMQSLLELSYPAHGDLLWDCKLSDTGEWQRARTSANVEGGALGEVITHDREEGTVTFRLFPRRSNAVIDAVRRATGELVLPLHYCITRVGSL